jgi:hypothetical protein
MQNEAIIYLCLFLLAAGPVLALVTKGSRK